MARSCPVCQTAARTEIWNMDYKIPDGWPLPTKITWYTCDSCGMLYGDGDFNQTMLNDYYQNYYGYGVDHPENTKRLMGDAGIIEQVVDCNRDAVIVDFGGGGDDGESVVVNQLKRRGFKNSCNVGIGDSLPINCDIIFASHVVEHIYDLPETMTLISNSLKPDGTLIIDGPDSTGILLKWPMPMLDYNTKHINHFTLRNYLDLGYRYGFEAVRVRDYELGDTAVWGAPAFQIFFKRMNTASGSKVHIATEIGKMLGSLEIYQSEQSPVNIWGMGDIMWHILASVELNIVNYIDNDPAYRGKTYQGKIVMERPDNDAPILILAQGQRQRLIDNIHKMGIENKIIEI